MHAQFHIKPLVDDLHARHSRKERRVLEDVVPGHPHSSQCFGAVQALEVAAAQLDAFGCQSRDRGLAEQAAFEENVLQVRAVEVALIHPAIAEHDAFELGEARGDEIELAVDEPHVPKGGLGKVGAGQAHTAQFRPQGGHAENAAVRPVGTLHDRVYEAVLQIRLLVIIRRIWPVRLERRLRHAARLRSAGTLSA
jgi:hypothetical protein